MQKYNQLKTANALATRKKMVISLKKLMQTIPLEKITVNDIVSDCGISRHTFYYHFQDIYLLLGWVYQTEVIEGLSKYGTYQTWTQGFLKIFNYVSANKKFCMNTYKSLGKVYIENFLHEATLGLVMRIVTGLSEGMHVDKTKQYFIAEFYENSFVGLLLKWLTDGANDDPVEIVSTLHLMIEGDIIAALKKLENK